MLALTSFFSQRERKLHAPGRLYSLPLGETPAQSAAVRDRRRFATSLTTYV